NDLDGEAFAAPFTNDADFVNIRAEHFRGRHAIAEGHTHIFQTIYAGSNNQMKRESVRLLHPEVALVHVRSLLDVPDGPMKGRHAACFSMVLTKKDDGWEIASFHNTMEPPARPRN